MKNMGRARYARRLAARSFIGALIVTAGLSGSIIGVAAGETLINGGEARPPDVTIREHPATTSEKASKPKAAKKKRPNTTTTTVVVIGPADQTPNVSPPQQDPDSSFRRGWWVISLVERNASSVISAPRHG